MPKIIKNAQAEILEAAKAELLLNGYGGLTIRAVAARCHIATGTIYNYYSGKDVLVAHIMLEDWRMALERMRVSCSEAASITKGFEGMHDALTDFRSTYNHIWSEYTFTGMGLSSYRERHTMLVGQLTELIHKLLTRHGANESEYLEEFLASQILEFGTQMRPFEQFAAVLDRIFKEDNK